MEWNNQRRHEWSNHVRWDFQRRSSFPAPWNSEDSIWRECVSPPILSWWGRFWQPSDSVFVFFFPPPRALILCCSLVSHLPLVNLSLKDLSPGNSTLWLVLLVPLSTLRTIIITWLFPARREWSREKPHPQLFLTGGPWGKFPTKKGWADKSWRYGHSSHGR